MSRLLTVALSLVVLFASGFAQVPEHQHREVRHLDFAANRIAVVGDSYTTGSDQGGNGPKGWMPQVWESLTDDGIAVTPTVAAEGGAGYCTRGNRGSVFEDLTVRAVKPSDLLVVFFGSRNDINVDPTRLSIAMYGTFKLARQIAPSADLLVIGPPWPTADPPPEVLRIRDVLGYQADLAGASFVDPIAARWFVGRPELIGADGVHPTDAGHTYMAQKIAPLIGAKLHPF
ncbi:MULTISPECIES: Rv0518 family GDSL lipase [Mycolicibacterium]|uniref:Lipolytic enzyme, G-D-S-L family n=1 Tax=Mycolicibacterium vanbaalenii (strain DSM 7251 / JCM 13017 / BCRC 16820 / KCTC 9966 / NRRL B-24157 / PYR-1) TaxID=350058 RepID=A1T9E0_MYCVP|nr:MULTISPECIES: GDSL lipase [Mycolicibacterium]ABM13790.1 lipolytic enzyme, G-D-S-L family [Mycolicibacterium vanbaalenii PYR-1]MCV7128782.1 SGNH/GDSL hydrolase family protein [Mycolicibacterium vanbaalenii PYR-1]PQP44692.1 SGNH/GDSL hydrolase family protein [Mycolicibacterium austroafricanum]QZT59715.1 SGNH/GDSL hydrolase family protein [Mycolicibacterium austroafricanum]UJL27442.1 SGNH/GDSL hydrolase family protein [Mycolicibacterium vanbaalenii]